MYPDQPTWTVPTKSLPKRSKRSTYGKQRKELGIEPLHSSEESQSKPAKRAWEPPFSSQSGPQPTVESDPFGRSGKQGPLRKIEPYPLPAKETKETESQQSPLKEIKKEIKGGESP